MNDFPVKTDSKQTFKKHTKIEKQDGISKQVDIKQHHFKTQVKHHHFFRN